MFFDTSTEKSRYLRKTVRPSKLVVVFLVVQDTEPIMQSVEGFACKAKKIGHSLSFHIFSMVFFFFFDFFVDFFIVPFFDFVIFFHLLIFFFLFFPTPKTCNMTIFLCENAMTRWTGIGPQKIR